MSLLEIQDIQENYGQAGKKYKKLSVETEMEKGSQSSQLWGKNLTLSFVDTIKYCSQKENFFVPSTSLLASIYIHCSEQSKKEENLIVSDINNYWLRTFSVIVFPQQDQDGYIVHYPHLEGDELKRERGKLVGDFVVEVKADSFPPLGKNATLVDYIDFFDALLGVGVTEKFSSLVKKTFNYLPNVWIPPQASIEDSPERLVIFGGLLQYGQSLWLTSNSPDKTIVGTRPFKGVYDLSSQV